MHVHTHTYMHTYMHTYIHREAQGSPQAARANEANAIVMNEPAPAQPVTIEAAVAPNQDIVLPDPSPTLMAMVPHVHTSIHQEVCVCTAHMCVYVLMAMVPHVHTSIHQEVRVYVCTYICVCICAYIYIYIYIYI
jgi:hypothetical protein